MSKSRGSALVQKIHRIEFHRNGVGGAPFYVVTFTGKGWEGEGSAELVATVFEQEGAVAVLSYNEGPAHEINPAQRWRGDNFERELREAIEVYNEEPDAHIDPTCNGLHEIRNTKGELECVQIPGCLCRPCPTCGFNPSPAELGEHAAAREDGFAPEPPPFLRGGRS